MDELVNSLRICGKIRSADDYCVAFHDGCCEAEPVCMYELMMKAADAIEELSKSIDDMNEANIALYGALPKWISVQDDLPEVPDGEMFSKGVYVTDGTEITKACIMRAYDGVTGWTYAGIGKITHWCEQIQLPEPPKEET